MSRPIDPNATIAALTNESNSESVHGFRLTVVEGSDAGIQWESKGEKCTIGCSPSCDLVLSDRTVSRFHCELVIGEKRARVKDLSSSNGTQLDGVRVLDAFLKRGSILKLGRTTLRFELVGRRNRLPISPRTTFGQLVGRSVRMRGLFALLERAAAMDAKVLLEGETGTGKSATARSIHMESKRKDGPFVMLDCGSIPANLLESELFGHVKGAFTGASDRAGAFEEASGGTLFLDEIGELPPELQPKLLTVLDDNRIRRVGESKQRSVDVRVITATNRDLREEVNAGRFREDLYYRIAVVKLSIPPLRKRPDDIPVLVERLLSQLGAAPEQVESLTSEDFLANLKQAAWPGNIRELRNYMEQCLVFDDALPLGNMVDAITDDSAGIRIDATLPFSEAKQKALAELERAYVLELLRLHNGKVSRAAAAAGIDRTYFYRLLRRHGINK